VASAGYDDDLVFQSFDHDSSSLFDLPSK